LKLDFAKNATKAHLAGRDDFPYLTVELDTVEEGTPVYGFGYPLPINEPASPTPGGVGWTSHVALGHRTTSAIVASTLEHTRPIMGQNEARLYVLDKALNYGNSGGPIILQESGSAFAVCSRFQPVYIPQGHGPSMMIPSLYGVAVSIANIAADLRTILGPSSQ
jgi:serine protease Do